MTEQEWLTSEDPTAMLQFAKHHDPTGITAQPVNFSDRKLRLFACACCRLVWDGVVCWRCEGATRPPIHISGNVCPDCRGTGKAGGLTDPRSRRAVEVAERYADGLATEEEFTAAQNDQDAMWQGSDFPFGPDNPLRFGWAARNCLLGPSRAAEEMVKNRIGTPAAQAALLRDIFGNPWRPATCGWRTVNSPRYMSAKALEAGASEEQQWFGDCLITSAVLALAKAAYEERLPDGLLDPVRLAILTDALEEAGCEDEEILFHLRGEVGCHHCEGAGYYYDPPYSLNRLKCPHCDEGLLPPTPHARGCWAIDLLLGKS